MSLVRQIDILESRQVMKKEQTHTEEKHASMELIN